MSELILGSQSPRRLTICQTLGLNCRVVSGDFDEKPAMQELQNRLERAIIPSKTIKAHLYPIVYGKQKAVRAKLKNSSASVLTADTVVVQGRKLLGQAENEDKASSMLGALQGKRHQVYTACLLSDGLKTVYECYKADVWFRRMTPVEIVQYIKKNKTLDAAGGYKIQEGSARLVQSFQGEYHTIMGLPLNFLYQHCSEFSQ